jgi:hypothetical protein
VSVVVISSTLLTILFTSVKERLPLTLRAAVLPPHPVGVIRGDLVDLLTVGEDGIVAAPMVTESVPQDTVTVPFGLFFTLRLIALPFAKTFSDLANSPQSAVFREIGEA